MSAPLAPEGTRTVVVERTEEDRSLVADAESGAQRALAKAREERRQLLQRIRKHAGELEANGRQIAKLEASLAGLGVITDEA